MKKGFTIIEIVLVFAAIFVVCLIVFPMALDNTKQARYISDWKKTYYDIEYILEAVTLQMTDDVQKKIAKATDSDDYEKIMLEILNPYLRIKTSVDTNNYKMNFMNKTPLTQENIYYSKYIYETYSGKYIGMKWNKSKSKKILSGIMFYDLNGQEEPNTWGKDIYGVNIVNGKVEPIGKHMNLAALNYDCSRKGTGTYCSYYYLIGGSFEE